MFAALKVDMLKTYDKVSWNFLGWLFDKMGFPPNVAN